MEQQNITVYDLFMSDSIDQLATSLCKAQGEFSVARKDKNNPFFKSKYADFESVVAASRPALCANGLSVIQSIIFEDGNHYLVTILLHNSGQWIKSKAQHNPLKADIQSLSSYNTYLKRMCYSSLLGIVCSDEDDDGQIASNPSREYQQPTVRINGSNRISDQQLETINSLSESTKEKILEFNKITSLIELTVEQYDKIMNMLKSRNK